MRFSARRLSPPTGFARKTSAIPPTAIRSKSMYFPNRVASGIRRVSLARETAEDSKLLALRHRARQAAQLPGELVVVRPVGSLPRSEQAVEQDYLGLERLRGFDRRPRVP